MPETHLSTCMSIAGDFNETKMFVYEQDKYKLNLVVYTSSSKDRRTRIYVYMYLALNLTEKVHLVSKKL